jgi:hypothetical protein
MRALFACKLLGGVCVVVSLCGAGAVTLFDAPALLSAAFTPLGAVVGSALVLLLVHLGAECARARSAADPRRAAVLLRARVATAMNRAAATPARVRWSSVRHQDLRRLPRSA